MTIQTIGAVPVSSATSLQPAGLGQEDFIKILLTQLTYQDPLKPMDNQQFIAQMAQFTTLEQTRQLNDKTDTLLSIQSANQSIGLLGKTVNVDTSNGLVVGVVTTVTFPNGTPELVVNPSSNVPITGVTLSQISLVR